jgi:hypothetical protein
MYIMNNNTTLFRLINLESEKIVINTIYKNNENEGYDLGMIELLNLIKEEIRIAKKYKNNIKLNDMNFNHIFMQSVKKGIIINTYKLDIQKKYIVDIKNNIYVSKNKNKNKNKNNKNNNNNNNNNLITIKHLLKDIFNENIEDNNNNNLEKTIEYKNLEDMENEIKKISSRLQLNNNTVEIETKKLENEKNKFYKELKEKEDEDKKKRAIDEKKKEQLRIFTSDLNIYIKLMSEIKKGERDIKNIPELFEDKFEIFSVLDYHNKLDDTDIYDEYLYLEESINTEFKNNDKSNKIENNIIFNNYDKDYVQHNINFQNDVQILSLEETLDNISSISDSQSEEESDEDSDIDSDNNDNIIKSYDTI